MSQNTYVYRLFTTNLIIAVLFKTGSNSLKMLKVPIVVSKMTVSHCACTAHMREESDSAIRK